MSGTVTNPTDNVTSKKLTVPPTASDVFARQTVERLELLLIAATLSNLHLHEISDAEFDDTYVELGSIDTDNL